MVLARSPRHRFSQADCFPATSCPNSTLEADANSMARLISGTRAEYHRDRCLDIRGYS